MLTSEKIMSATKYNEQKSGTLYNESDLDWPFNLYGSGSHKRVVTVYSYQKGKGLEADGCLGPLTFASMRKSEKPKPKKADQKKIPAEKKTPAKNKKS